MFLFPSAVQSRDTGPIFVLHIFQQPLLKPVKLSGIILPGWWYSMTMGIWNAQEIQGVYFKHSQKWNHNNLLYTWESSILWHSWKYLIDFVFIYYKYCFWMCLSNAKLRLRNVIHEAHQLSHIYIYIYTYQINAKKCTHTHTLFHEIK